MFIHRLNFFVALLSVFLATAFNLSAQQDFNNFQTLQSVGKVPADFTTKTTEKIEALTGNLKTDLTPREEQIFLEGISFGIDELLHSGLVMYGDEISTYINEVADKVLLNQRKLRKQLRFYVVKSNETNALSTSQGIILVTTGLISQLTNEAQLAFILAHEIAHFREKHVVESYVEGRRRRSSIGDKIRTMAQYSKEKELEADYIGVDLYNLAGYARENITTVFDVLMYSYLPIDEIPFSDTYFNTDIAYIPSSRFSKKIYPIQAVEDYDDTYSSHPNIKKRKEKALEAANDIVKWGDITFSLGEERFYYVRQLARFESLRTDLLNAQYGNALYTIYILEKENPNSIYLSRMKCQAWLGLMAYKSVRDLSETIKRRREWEGESPVLFEFILSLSNEELATLAVRIIEDNRQKFPEDEEIRAIWEKSIKYLSEVKDLSLGQFADVSWYELQSVASTDNVDTPDSTNTINQTASTPSKYDRIRAKKDITNPENIDSSSFHLYLIPDLIQDDDFLNLFKKFKNEKKEREDREDAYAELSLKEKRKYDKEHQFDQRADLTNFVLVEPYGLHLKKDNSIKYSKSEKLQEDFNRASYEAADELGLNAQPVSKFKLEEGGTKMFNDKNVFTSLLIQLSQKDDLEIFPVDYSLLSTLKKEYGTSKLVFSIVEHEYRVQTSPYDAYLFLVFPVIPYRLINLLVKSNLTTINMIVLDTEKVEVETGFSREFRDPVSFYGLKAHVLDIYSQLNKK